MSRDPSGNPVADGAHTEARRKSVLGVAVLAAGIALSAGTAGATPPGGPYTWCPGDPPVATGNIRVNPVVWDETICHEYWYVYFGQGNVAQNIWDGPNPPDPPPTIPYKPLPPLPPGMCWTVGALIPMPVKC